MVKQEICRNEDVDKTVLCMIMIDPGPESLPSLNKNGLLLSK